MEHLDQPRETLIHQSANRPHLILGGDRELVLLAGLTAACLAFTLASITGIVVGLVFWLSSVVVLSRMGKADPMLRQIYLRHIGYKGFYPAKSHFISTAFTKSKAWR
jgi:type IV secretory pathway TrbD component